MRGGLPRHPSLEPCSESLAWSQPTGLNCPAGNLCSWELLTTHIVRKTHGLVIPPPLHEGAIRDIKSNLRNSLILTLTSDARDLDSGLYIVPAMSSPRPKPSLCPQTSVLRPMAHKPPVWQSRITMQHSACTPKEKHCPLALPRNPK